MNIVVTTGKGVGATKLSAFDAALWDAGIAGYNLIYLSSVIPSDCEIVKEKYRSRREETGWKLYCVISINYLSPGDASESWAGLGWASLKGRGGVFIEEAAASRDGVIEKIRAAYGEMSSRRGNIGALETIVVQAPSPDPFSCAVAVAVYQAEPWGPIKENQIMSNAARAING